MPRKPRFTPKPATPPRHDGPRPGQLTLSPEAQQLFDEVDGSWELTPPVRALLRIADAHPFAGGDRFGVCGLRERLAGDAKGAAKPHPMALLARDYRAQAATTLQRILSNLGAI